MIELILPGLLLAALACGFVALGFFRTPGRAAASGREAQVAFYRQRLEELRRERELNALDERQFAELETELERQLLAETGEMPERLRGFRLGRWPALAFILALPLASYWLYQSLGAPTELALNRLQQQIAQQRSMGPEELQRMRELVDQGLQRRPDKLIFLSLQARMAMEAGEYRKAAGAYQRLVERHPQDAALLAQWAQALYLADNRSLTPRVRDLLNRALELDPNQTSALGLLGIDAFSRGQYGEAIEHWQRLLRAQPADSPQMAVIADGVRQAKARALAAGQLTGLMVTVDIAPAVAERAEGTLYVFAKAEDGSPLPVAVVRQPARGQWPRTVVLTDADAMRPERTLSQFDTVTVTARVSKGGSVMARPGDLQGQKSGIAVNDESGEIEVLIDEVVE